MTKDLNTEERIKEAAKRVFFKKGLSGARMQEIADEAQINKAMLHYYYRSKELLFKGIFEEVIATFAPAIAAILVGDRPLNEKVSAFVSTYLELLLKEPYLPLFLFSELRNHPEEVIDKIGIKRLGVVNVLTKQLDEEAKAGNIKYISAMQFFVNLMSLTIFPFIAQPMLQGVFDMDEKAFRQFVEERKQTIPEFIMSSLRA